MEVLMLSPEVMCVLSVRFVILVVTLIAVVSDNKFTWRKFAMFFAFDFSIGIVGMVHSLIKYQDFIRYM
jgi:hypothetical protein